MVFPSPVSCFQHDTPPFPPPHKVFYNDTFRMELVRYLWCKTFLYVDKTSAKPKFGEMVDVNIERQLSSVGSPDGNLAKERFMEAVIEYKHMEVSE